MGSARPPAAREEARLRGAVRERICELAVKLAQLRVLKECLQPQPRGTARLERLWRRVGNQGGV